MKIPHMLFPHAWILLAAVSVIQPDQRACGEGRTDHVQYYGPYGESPLAAIRPEGWLREYLVRQSAGLTGHLEEAGHPFNSTGWYDTTLAPFGWAVYEQNAYWVDGMIRCARLIDDTALAARPMRQIDYVLDHADPDGYLGPKFMKLPGELNRWPHVVFFRAMMAEYGKTRDPRIPEALRRHYLSRTDPHSSHRNVINVEIMLWTYAHTRDPRLLALAEHSYAEYNRISREVTTLANMQSDDLMNDFHGVTFNETAKLAAILYLYTGKKEYLDAVEHAYAKVDQHYMLLDGVHSSTEGMRSNSPLESHETCDIADYTWSMGYLLMATGNATYADKIERACFNAAPGAVTKDFKALQYFSCPNQVIADRRSNHNEFSHGSAWMSYRPNPGTECCPGDVNRIMPNYASRTWMTDTAGSPVAALFGPSRYRFTAGNTDVTIREETAYPFEEEIRFTVTMRVPARFAFSVRIPVWTRNPEISIRSGGKVSTLDPRPGQFARIERVFRNGDRIIVKVPMHVTLSSWPEGGVGVERGPLVHALGIRAVATIDTADRRSTSSFPAWNMRPGGPWNYALDLTDSAVERQISVVRQPLHGYPWDEGNAPVMLRVPARRVHQWALEPDSTRPGTLYTPHLPGRSSIRGQLAPGADTLTLVPYGCTLLRQSIFPLAGEYANVTGRTAEPECLVARHFGEDSLNVDFYTENPGTQIRYTLDGTEPGLHSALFERPFPLNTSAVVKAIAYHEGTLSSFTTSTALHVLRRKPAAPGVAGSPGLSLKYFEGEWERIPEFSRLTPKSTASVPDCSLERISHRRENWAAVLHGSIVVPQAGLYRFFLTSDDGSRLLLDGMSVIDNDGAHAPHEVSGYEILDAGKHSFELEYFQGTGGFMLSFEVVPPGGTRQPVPGSWLHHD